ncbi:TPA: terminase, partial [Klebsiella pneumoniae]
PGKGDALLLTFAYPVAKRSDFPAAGGKQPNVISEYDPWA